ncbi:transposase [Stenotrophomonas maltophilia]|nr:transposase [Stenotrophomonas maltophilia]
MTTSASPAAGAATAALPLHPAALAGQAGNVPLTRVSLAYLEHRFKLYLRFGEPARMLQLDRWRRCAVFLPGALLCRIRWQANEYGTIRWQLMVMQACTPLDAAQRIPGVQPGARLLLHAEGDASVRTVLERIDGIEALGIAPTAVSPAYWRTLANRLAARSPLPEYSIERHAAWLAGRTLP